MSQDRSPAVAQAFLANFFDNAAINKAIVAGVKTVGAVAAELFAGASRLVGRGYMEVYNGGSVPIFYGGSGVTVSSGCFPIQPGESKTFYFTADTPVYFVAASSNANVYVEER